MNETTQEHAAKPEPEPEAAATSSVLESARGFLRKPAVGASVAGAAVLAAGAFVGVTEALIAGAVAYAVFRSLRKAPAKA